MLENLFNDDFEIDYTDYNSDGDDSLLHADGDIDEVIDDLVHDFAKSTVI